MVDVYLSPSAQQFNKGCGCFGTEQRRMNQIADVVQYELERHGAAVRRSAPDLTIREAVADSNALSPRFHIAIHSGAGDGNSRGAGVYAHRRGGEGAKLADNIYNEIKMISPTEGLGVRAAAPLYGGQGLYELRYTKATAVLVEVSFRDNPEDAQYIVSNIYQLGNAVAKGALDTLGITYRQDTAENISELKRRYNDVF